MVEQMRGSPPKGGVGLEAEGEELVPLPAQCGLRDVGRFPRTKLVHDLELVIALGPWELREEGRREGGRER